MCTGGDILGTNEEHKKKMIAPIVITVIVVIYYLLYFGIILAALDGFIIIKIMLGIIPLALSGTMIYVCIQRINEINGGEEDDIGKY